MPFMLQTMREREARERERVRERERENVCVRLLSSEARAYESQRVCATREERMRFGVQYQMSVEASETLGMHQQFNLT